MGFHDMQCPKTSFLFSFFSNFALPIKHTNSSLVSVIVLSAPSPGQRNLPRSNRLKYTQNPSASHSNILIRSRALLQKTKSASENGSNEKLCCTNIIRPLIDFLISVCPQQRYTDLSPKLSIATATLGTFLPTTLKLYLLRLILGILQFRSRAPVSLLS